MLMSVAEMMSLYGVA